MRPTRFDWRSAPGAVRLALRSAWAWLFAARPQGWLVSWALVCLLALDVGASTATASWVPGSDALGGAAVLGALAGGLVALARRLRAVPGLLTLLLLGLLISGERVGWPVLRADTAAALSGDVTHGGALLLFAINLLIWVVAAWLAWCVLRWRQPLLALVPGVATFATTLLNFPAGQDAFLVYFAALTVALLLWAGYRRSIEQAARRGLRLTPESRWDFWESGVVAAIGLLVVAFFAPPLSTVDRTVDAQTGLIKTWADLQVRMHHALPAPADSNAVLSTGFSEQVDLGHPLTRNGTVVFTYKVSGAHTAPLYFRGLAIDATSDGEWRYVPSAETSQVLAPGTFPSYADTYDNQQPITVTVDMLRPPAGDRSVFFYPGQLRTINKPALISQASTDAQVYSIDRLASLTPTTQGSYKVTATYPTADETQLRAAGADYPAWVLPYQSANGWGATYRAPSVEQQIQALAAQVTRGASNPYDAAVAIQNYLRKYTYTLKPPATPAGADPLAFFLFQSKKGYCEYFASAMGDMLRSLGIPTRLVNGYGPGQLDGRTGTNVVRESDAHTWVEVFFPQYGWVPFEPTPDGTYFPIPRGSTACLVESAACSSGPPVAIQAGNHRAPADVNPQAPGFRDPSGGRGTFGLPFNPIPYVLGFLALLAALVLVAAVRILTPRTAGGAWRRAQMLSRLAGVPPGPAETPLEFGRRLARALPVCREGATALARAFTQAAYAPPELAAAGAEEAVAAWQALRPVLLREAAARVSGRR